MLFFLTKEFPPPGNFVDPPISVALVCSTPQCATRLRGPIIIIIFYLSPFLLIASFIVISICRVDHFILDR